jgi:streptomycin 6-kinase
MNLSQVFVNNVTESFGESGLRLQIYLPSLLAEATNRWTLSPGDPFLLSYNYVCAVTREDGTSAVLKIGVPNRELTSEINALRVYNGQGACRLLEADDEKGMLLLERLYPGKMLSTIEDDDLATKIAAKVMKNIQFPVIEEMGFINLQSWFNEFKGLRSPFSEKTGKFPRITVAIVKELICDLFAENPPLVLLHGDFHHFNILSSDRGWLVIDPKGVAGPAEYEVGPFLINPIDLLLTEKDALLRTERRIAILAEQLGFDRLRMWKWAICHSLLSAWWDTKEDGSGGENSLAWTETLLKGLI